MSNVRPQKQVNRARLVITSVPPGEAPRWVREQWVGVTLPLAQKRTEAMLYLTSGVLNGPRSVFSLVTAFFSGKRHPEPGFGVEAGEAIEVLAAIRPEAAAWWRENAPHLVSSKRYFVFHRDVAHVLKDETAA